VLIFEWLSIPGMRMQPQIGRKLSGPPIVPFREFDLC
jgi:hypothetical protein